MVEGLSADLRKMKKSSAASPKVQEVSSTFLCSSTHAAASESTFLLSGPEKDFLTGRPLLSLPA